MYIGREVIITATVQDWPEVKNNQTRLHLGSPRFNYSTSALNCQIYATMSGVYDDIARSDQITLRAMISEGFGDYAVSVYRPTLISISKPDPPDYFVTIRNIFTKRIRQAIGDSEEANLALGFLIGEKALSEDFKAKLRAVGLSHIVVASGFCLAILSIFAQKSMRKVSRFASYAFAGILILSFIMVAGLSPSLLRAGLVTGSTLTAGYFGRKFHPGRLLAYVVAISILINPLIIKSLA
jgi:competence protein ComEC